MSNCVKVSALPWDTEFFGFSVGRMDLSANACEVELRTAIASSSFELTYVFLPVGGAMEGPRSALVALGGRCYDLKLTYRKSLSDGMVVNDGSSFAANEITPELTSLAYASGWCSRFVSDDRLARFFKPLYLQWLKRDFLRGKVFVRPSLSNPEGMVTVSVQGHVGRVGLLAVDAGHCRCGIATGLLQDIDVWFTSQGVKACEVVTQGINVAAQKLYEKSGYKLSAQTEVWHVWKGS